MEPEAARPKAPDPAARACASARTAPSAGFATLPGGDGPFRDSRTRARRALRAHAWSVEIGGAAGRFLDCGLLEHGFARVRCDTCRAEFLVAFRCKGRHFCPSCHARRLAEWSAWLDEQLLAPVPRRHVVLTLPKRLRAYFVHDRRRLALLSRLAARRLRAFMQAALDEHAAAVPGLVVCMQTFGSVANFHPHLHVLMTDGGFRGDGSFVPLSEPEVGALEALWQRVVLAESVRRDWLEQEPAAAMLAWPHSGFGADVGPRIEERAALLRVARYAARAPVAESRLRYDAERAEVELVSDRAAGPYAGVHWLSALEFLTRWVDHVAEHHEVRGRSRRVGGCGSAGARWSSSRPHRPLRRLSRRRTGRRSRRGGGAGRNCCGWCFGLRWRPARAALALRGSYRSSPNRWWFGGSSRTWRTAASTRAPGPGRGWRHGG